MPTRVLIIGYVWPEPRSSAAGSHMMQIIEQFRLHLSKSQEWEIIFASPAQAGPTRADLKILGIQEAVIELNSSDFDVWVKELNPDIVVFDRFMMEEQFGWRVAEQCPQALRILETSDLHSLRDIRQQLLKQNPDTIPQASAAELYNAMSTEDITQREIAAIYRCDISLIISDFEMDLLINQFKVPENLLCYCPFMLDAPDTRSWPTFDERHGFITIGNFLHAPNWDSILWLAQSIWPMIRAKLPQAECFIYGAYPSQKVLDLHKPKQGFHVLGWTEDAQQVMKQARVCLAPLRFGAGVKGKLVDAMLCGTPAVTTSIGAEGLGLYNNDSNYNTTEAFANAAIELYTQQALWEQTQQHASIILNQRFNKQKIGEKLVQQITDCHNHLEQHRRSNFNGLMLQHHQHKSTEYMARWIETKNKLKSV